MSKHPIIEQLFADFANIDAQREAESVAAINAELEQATWFNLPVEDTSLNEAIERGISDYDADRAVAEFTRQHNAEVEFFGAPLDAPAGVSYEYYKESGLYVPKR